MGSLDFRRCDAHSNGVNWPGWRNCSQFENDMGCLSANAWNARRGHAIRLRGAQNSGAVFEKMNYARLLPWAAGRGMLN
jgi:hypothetical protein